jgi:hypothetical protein
MKERKPITREFAVRYRTAKTRPEKSQVPDDFITATGYSRKYTIGILGGGGKTKILCLRDAVDRVVGQLLQTAQRY